MPTTFKLLATLFVGVWVTHTKTLGEKAETSPMSTEGN